MGHGIPNVAGVDTGSSDATYALDCSIRVINAAWLLLEERIQCRANKHRKTLQAVFAEPIRANVKWTDVEHLLRALGAEMTEGSGSRIRIHLQGVRAVFHRPHPQPDMGKGALKSMRRFLEQVGVKLEAGDHVES